MTDSTLNPTPQFGTAEYAGVPGTDHCQYCHQPIAGTYYRANESLACPTCADKIRADLARDTHSAFVRGLLFGIGAAIAGMILYAVFAIATGIIIGYVSLAVGWLVGKAIIKGSGGVGGKRYQIAAAVLTYCAVSVAAVPIWIHYANEQHAPKQQHARAANRPGSSSTSNRLSGSSTAESSTSDSSTSPSSNSASSPSPTTAPTEQSPPSESARPTFFAAMSKLLLLGLASPFLEIWEGGPSFQWVIGIVILAVGIRIAWRLTAAPPRNLFGPFENSSRPSA
jgi:predicted lipid-binding transport protein (Tim44 family)